MTYLKIGAAVLLIALLFGGGWYCGSLKSRAALDHSLAAQSATVAAALLAQRKISDAEEDRLNAVIAKYEATPIDPVSLTVGTRLFKYAAASCSTVPSAPTPPSGASSPPALPTGPTAVELASDAAFKACAEDSAELAAIQAAWPKS